jgi:IS30 family transposase
MRQEAVPDQKHSPALKSHLPPRAEMVQHKQLRMDTGLQIYFCDPHRAWQCGTNERELQPHSTAALARLSDGELQRMPSTRSQTVPSKGLAVVLPGRTVRWRVR